MLLYYSGVGSLRWGCFAFPGVNFAYDVGLKWRWSLCCATESFVAL